jgi:hypothetical protein
MSITPWFQAFSVVVPLSCTFYVVVHILFNTIASVTDQNEPSQACISYTYPVRVTDVSSFRNIRNFVFCRTADNGQGSRTS